MIPFLTAALLLSVSTTASAQSVGGGTGGIFQWDGVATGDAFGTSVSDAGDVNGDGIADVIVGAPFADSSGFADVGSATVYSGIDGTIILQLQGVAAEDQFGTSVSSAGDLNGDGYADVMVGAPKHDPGGLSNAGSVFIYSGADGTQLFQVDGVAIGNHLGNAISLAGDVDADGTMDLILAASAADFRGQADVGKVTIYSGATGIQLYQWNGRAAEDNFGWSVSAAGDLNADGYADMLIGAPHASSGGLYHSGAAYLYSGQDGTLLREWQGGQMGDNFGNSISDALDINADGTSDILVGAYKSDFGSLSNTGSAYAYSGIDGALIHQWNSQVADDHFGSSIAGLGDINHDGYAEVAVGAPNANTDFLWDAGSVHIYSGADGALLYQWGGEETKDLLGCAMSVVEDIDGDGIADLVVGAAGASPGGLSNAGSAYVFSFSPFLSANTSTISASAGGTLELELNFPVASATQEYKVLISASGTGPTNLGVLIPLTWDPLFLDTYFGHYPISSTTNMHGTLDANGDASANLTLPPGIPSSFIGRTYHLAAVANPAGELPAISSVALSLTIVP